MKQTKKFIAQKVRERLAERHLGGVTLEVLDANIHKIDKWWHVPVRPDVWPKRLSDYYETLAEVADELQESDQIDVIFLPAHPLRRTRSTAGMRQKSQAKWPAIFCFRR